MGVSMTSVPPDNQAIGEMRDLLKESKKQSNYMLWLTIAVVIMTLIQVLLLIFK